MRRFGPEDWPKVELDFTPRSSDTPVPVERRIMKRFFFTTLAVASTLVVASPAGADPPLMVTGAGSSATSGHVVVHARATGPATGTGIRVWPANGSISVRRLLLGGPRWLRLVHRVAVSRKGDRQRHARHADRLRRFHVPALQPRRRRERFRARILDRSLRHEPRGARRWSGGVRGVTLLLGVPDVARSVAEHPRDEGQLPDPRRLLSSSRSRAQ